ncbi:MAG: GNAT family N-acetyltransferase [Planctomycetota bacterium]
MVDIVHGIPEHFRSDAANLFEQAFAAKFSVAVPSASKRMALVRKGLHLTHSFAAISNDRLVGLVGYQTDAGSFTGGITYQNLLDQLGLLGGHRAALIFHLYERSMEPHVLLLDGIAVDVAMRGQGIGTQLLDAVAKFAVEQRFKSIRLDVIDTNDGARRLYERNQFIATRTETFGYLRWLLGFGASTTLTRAASEAVS